MWIMLYDCFFSIVKRDCADDELMVRARRKGDIEKIWKNTKVTRYTKSDYLYRAAIKKVDVVAAISTEIEDIDYDNFKNAVKDIPYHRALNHIWTELSMLQELPPYSGYSKELKTREEVRYDRSEKLVS